MPASTSCRASWCTKVKRWPTHCDAHGYRAIYATDEVRFANFDELLWLRSAGYATDRRLGLPARQRRRHAAREPRGRPGAAALACSRTFMRTAPHLSPIGQRQFTRSGSNAKSTIDGAGFLAIHLTLVALAVQLGRPCRPHRRPQEYRARLSPGDERKSTASSTTCSALLRRKGVLDNAIVVVLSDHGEALGLPTDSIDAQDQPAVEIWDSLWGHGTSVMSPHQYRVSARDACLRAARAARRPRPRTTGR